MTTPTLETKSTRPAKHGMLWLAIILAVVWLVLRIALAVTSAFLHLIWIAAVIFAILWLLNRLATK
jgi:hypothetical protein